MCIRWNVLTRKTVERDNRDYEHEHTKTCSEEMHEYSISIDYPALTRHYAMPICKWDVSLKRIKFLETNRFWKADSRPFNKKIYRILWKATVPPYFHHNRPAKLNLNEFRPTFIYICISLQIFRTNNATEKRHVLCPLHSLSSALRSAGN
jgi:hypothetical protein